MQNTSKRLVFGLRCLVYGAVAVVVIAGVILLCTGKSWRSPYEAPSLDEVHQRYLTEEGHQRRGARFEQLALTIDRERLRGRSFSMSEIRGYLGPPDRVVRAGGQESLQYYYDRSGAKDSVVIVTIDEEQKVVLGYAARSWLPNPDDGPERNNGLPPTSPAR